MTTGIHQSNHECPQCGSMYRIVDKCNICGTVSPDLPEAETRFIRAQRGKQWSKKLHRYLTEKEIKEGMVGG